MTRSKTTFSLSDEIKERLETFSKEHMMIKSQIVERALEEFMNKKDK